MFRVEWKFRGNNDRVLVLLPPITDSMNSILENPYPLQQLRTTLLQLRSQENIKYVVVYIPFLDVSQFKNIELFERIYGVEMRLLETLSQLSNAKYIEHLTNECVYLLKNNRDWLDLSAHPQTFERMFDVCITEQLYKSYDPISKMLRTSIKQHCEKEFTVGANFVKECISANLHMSKRIPFEPNILASLGCMHQDDNEGDIVLILGNLGVFEHRHISAIVEAYLKECRLTAVYVYGNCKELLKPLMEQYPEISFQHYNNNLIEPDMIKWLWGKLKRHGPKTNTFVFLGKFEIDEAHSSMWEELEKPYLRACIFTPESWTTLHTKANIIQEKHAFLTTFEPIGLLEYFIDEVLQINDILPFSHNNQNDYNDDFNDDDDNDTQGCEC